MRYMMLKKRRKVKMEKNLQLWKDDFFVYRNKKCSTFILKDHEFLYQ